MKTETKEPLSDCRKSKIFIIFYRKLPRQGQKDTPLLAAEHSSIPNNYIKSQDNK